MHNGAVMLSEAKHLGLFSLVDRSQFDPRFFASLRMTLIFMLLDIDSHRHRAGNILPARALPEFSTAEIVVGHQDNSAHDANAS